MPLQPDDTVCFCFHVPLRKIESFCRLEKPAAASQISECLSAGTGCGWCVPILKRIHTNICGEYKPAWRQEDAAPAELPTAEDHAAGRARYLARGKKRDDEPTTPPAADKTDPTP